MDKYIVVTGEDLEEFSKEVNQKMSEGYTPIGGVCHCVWVENCPTELVEEDWSQAMWK